MKNRLKLLSVALVLAFLVGCGGSSSGKEDTISLELLQSHFPLFETNATIYQVQTDKQYRVSNDDVKSFEADINQSYTYNGNREYSKANVYFKINGINATVALDTNYIELTLLSSNGAAFDAIAEDATYTELFGTLGGDVIRAHIHKSYNQNISSKYDAYVTELRSWGFTCSINWECNKKVDKIYYRWYANGNYSYVYGAHL